MRTADFAEFREIVEYAVDRALADLTPETNLYTELRMDSIGAVALVVETQRRFGVRIPDADIPELRTPAQFVDKINAMVAAPL